MAGNFDYKIIVVGDHRILRQGLRIVLERVADFVIVDDVDCGSALAKIQEHRPNIALLDLKPPQVDNGLALLAEISRLERDTRVITLLPHGENSDLLMRAIRAGASGYVPEDTGDIAMIEEAIRKVAHGQLYLSNTLLVTLLSTISANEAVEPLIIAKESGILSPREQAVLDLVALGCTNRQISTRLVISESTTRTHVHNILDKLQLNNRVQMATYALNVRGTSGKKARVAPIKFPSIVETGT